MAELFNYSKVKDYCDELESRVKMLQLEVDQWKSDANESIARLKKRNGGSSVDRFFEALLSKLIQSVVDENGVLKRDKVNKSDSDNEKLLVLKLQRLQHEFEMKCDENGNLLGQLENINSPHITLKKQFTVLDDKYCKMLEENLSLKHQLSSNSEVLPYLNTKFNKEKDDFFKIFMQYYREHGDDFVKPFDLNNNLPEFLGKPLLRRDASTCIDNDIIDPPVSAVKVDLSDSLKDSGIDTIPEEMREVIAVSRELEEAYLTIKRLEEEVNKDEETYFTDMCKLNAEKEEYLRNLQFQYRQSEEDLGRKMKKLAENENEVLSWKAAYAQYSDDAEQIQREKNQLERNYKLLEERYRDLVKSERTSAARQQSFPQEEPRRYLPSTHSLDGARAADLMGRTSAARQQSFPQEEPRRYLPSTQSLDGARAVDVKPRSSSDMHRPKDSRSTRMERAESSPEEGRGYSITPSLFKSTDNFKISKAEPIEIDTSLELPGTCQNCNVFIEADKYLSHILHCSKSSKS